jgi:hypothetical protein
VVVLHPDYWEAEHQEYNGAFVRVVQALKQLPNLEIVDVLDAWRSRGLLAGHAVEDLYWRIDGHNTPKGYAAFGDAVAGWLLRPGAGFTVSDPQGE